MPEEIEKIIRRSAGLLKIRIDEGAAREIAARSRATPRIGNYLLKRCRDFAQIRRGALTEKIVEEALALLGIDELGLNASDRSLLQTLIEKFGGGPVGLNTSGSIDSGITSIGVRTPESKNTCLLNVLGTIS